MASNKYAEYEKILYGTSSGTKSPTRTLNNTKARLEAAGVNPDTATDKRNIVEKALNLKQDQNILFDLFELLNRPQQALFNAWEAGQKGEDIGGAAWKGLSGQNEVKFKDILKNYGMEDVEGKIDASDVLGFAGDVFLDPMNLIPVAGFDEFGKALDAGESFGKAAKNLKTGSDVVMSGIGKGIKGTAKLADKGIEKALAKADELAGVVDNAGNVVKFTYDDTTVKNAADLVKRAVDTGEDISSSVVGKLENYKQIKNDISRMFKVSDRYKNAILTKRGQELGDELSRAKNAIFTDKELKIVEDYAKKYGEDASKVADEITMFLEASLDRTETNEKILRLAKQGKLNASEEVVDALNKMIAKDIPDDLRAAYDVGVTVSDQGKVVLGKDLLNGRFDLKPMHEDQLLKAQTQLQQAISDGNTDAIEELTNMINDNITNYGYHYTKEQMKDLRNIVKKYTNNADYRNIMDEIVGTGWKGQRLLNFTGELSDVEKLLDKARKVGDTSTIKPGVINTLNANIDELMGTDLSNKYDVLANAGYFPQTLTEEGQKALGAYNKYIGDKSGSIGSTALLSERTWLGSAAEKNNRFNDLLKSMDNELLEDYPELAEFISKDGKLFEENFFKAVTNRYLDPQGISSVAKNANLSNKVLAKSVFGDTDEMISLQQQITNAETLGDTKKVTELSKELNKLSDKSGLKFLVDSNDIVPKGYTQVSKQELLRDLKKYQTLNSQVGIDSGLGSIIKSIEKYNGQIAIDTDIVDMFHWANKRDNYTGLAGLYNSYMNMFKKWKTASPTFLLNNLTGNSSNLMLSGISLKEQAKYSETVMEILGKGQDYYLKRLAGEALDANGNKIADLWQMYRSMGFDQSALALQELPQEFQEMFKSGKKIKNVREAVTNGIPYINNYLNIQMDNSARLVVMLKCIDDPGYMRRLGVNNIQEAISRVMFDPDMLTSFERNKIKKIIPFYTYAKNNLMYHITNMSKNGKKYSQLMKSMKGLQDLATDGNSENMSDFLKEGLYIPLPGVDKDGNYKVLRASLPFGQVLEFASNPRDELVSMLTPAIKNPLEMTMNKDTFTGKDIESFPGELSKNIPFVSKKTEKMISDFTGLDVPIKNATRITQGTIEGLANDQDILQSLGEGLRRTVIMDNNVNNDKLFRTYEEIDDLQNLMKQYQQKGYNFATITELKRANKNKTIEGIDAIFNKYGIE